MCLFGVEAAVGPGWKVRTSSKRRAKNYWNSCVFLPAFCPFLSLNVILIDYEVTLHNLKGIKHCRNLPIRVLISEGKIFSLLQQPLTTCSFSSRVETCEKIFCPCWHVIWSCAGMFLIFLIFLHTKSSFSPLSSCPHFPHIPLPIYSTEWVRPPLGSQHSLVYQWWGEPHLPMSRRKII